VAHPLGCHRPRIPDRLADSTCSATTICSRRDEWITAGVFTRIEQICLEAYDRIVALDLADLTVDGCIVKAPCGGELLLDRSVQRTQIGETACEQSGDGTRPPVPRGRTALQHGAVRLLSRMSWAIVNAAAFIA